MRQLIKNLLPHGLVTVVKRQLQARRDAAERTRMESHCRAKTQHYFATHPVRKLHLGCGYRPLNGWLNTDLTPRTDEVIYLDATKRFPFEDNSFDYAFNEHVIEHMTYPQGIGMLRECLRVLKPGGKIRVATPNLIALLQLCTPHKTDVQMRYLDWSAKRYSLPNGSRSAEVFVVNNFFYSFGHKFIYDPPTLAEALRRAGFVNIIERNVGESDDEHLRGIEQHGRDITDEFNRLETFVLEATKP